MSEEVRAYLSPIRSKKGRRKEKPHHAARGGLRKKKKKKKQRKKRGKCSVPGAGYCTPLKAQKKRHPCGPVFFSWEKKGKEGEKGTSPKKAPFS